MKKFYILIAMLLVNALPAAAEDKAEPQGPSTFAMIGILEGAAAMNSYIASRGPGGYGITMLVLEPFFIPPKASWESWLAYGAVASIPLYNLSISDDYDSDKINSKDVFARNMIAWNLLGGIFYLLIQDEEEAIKPKEDNELKMGLMPIKDGMQLSMHYQF